MARGQKHIGPNGPGDCTAKTNESCPYSKDGHYETEREVEAAFEAKMEREGQSYNSKIQKEIQQLKAELNATFAGRKLSEISLEELESAGKKIDELSFEKVGLDSSRNDFSQDELGYIASANSQLLKELGSEVTDSANFSGPHAKSLREAIAVLPSSAAAIVTNDVYTKTVNAKSATQDGYHIAQAEVLRQINSESYSSMKLSPKAERGDYVLDSMAHSRFEIEDGTYQGFSLQRVEKPIGADIADGESAISALRGSKDRFIELMQNGVVDSDGVILPGNAERFAQMAPEAADYMRQVALARSHWVGEKPKGAIAKGKSYKKIADSVEITDSNGEKFTINKPLYSIEEKVIDHNAHTIATKNYGNDSSSKNPVLLHEFTHAIQSAAPGGIPGEKAIFQEIYSKKDSRKTGDGYSYYEGFPDEYMGDVGGREVFTRATEGLFYPQYSDNGYLYEGRENSEKVRTWALGAWAYLSTFKQAQS